MRLQTKHGLHRISSRRRGASMLEYVVLLLAVGVLCSGAVLFLGGALRDTGEKATDKVTGYDKQAGAIPGKPMPGVNIVEEP